jgi:hypothetical protein
MGYQCCRCPKATLKQEVVKVVVINVYDLLGLKLVLTLA